MDRMEKILENQKKREAAMKEKEEKRRQEEEEKKKKQQAAITNLPSVSQLQNDPTLLDYEKEELARRVTAAERRRKEEEDIKKRAEQRLKADLAGDSIQETDWKELREEERKKKEREDDKKWRELDKTSTQKLNQKIQQSNQELAERQEKGGVPQSKPKSDVDLSGVKDNNCLWGCKCPGFETAGSNKTGPELCKHCSHAKSMHH